MADFPDNLHLPRGLDEGDLLAWIEGEPCPASKRAAIAAWLSREPAVARLVEAMRHDRAGLQSLGRESAPASLVSGIADQIEPLLERQMLLGLSQGEDLHDHPPVSVVRPPRHSLLGAFFAERLGRRMAMAAAVLLLVGGSTYFIAQSLSGPGPGPGPMKARVVRVPDVPQVRSETDPTAVAAAPLGDETGMTMLKADPVEDEAAGATRMAGIPASDSLEATGASQAVAEATLEPAMGPELPAAADPVRAAALAREGRLIIRVKATDAGLIIRPDRVLTRMQRAQSPAWTVEGPAPTPLALAVAQPFPSDLESRLPQPRREVTIASGEVSRMPQISLEQYGPPLPTLADAVQKGPTVYSVNARVDAAALARLRQVISGAGGEVIFEESAEPLPGSTEPILTPQSMLWWGQTPAGWTRWARVPVVVDVAR
jgi:hypothetical protein